MQASTARGAATVEVAAEAVATAAADAAVAEAVAVVAVVAEAAMPPTAATAAAARRSTVVKDAPQWSPAALASSIAPCVSTQSGGSVKGVLLCWLTLWQQRRS